MGKQGWADFLMPLFSWKHEPKRKCARVPDVIVVRSVAMSQQRKPSYRGGGPVKRTMKLPGHAHPCHVYSNFKIFTEMKRKINE